MKSMIIATAMLAGCLNTGTVEPQGQSGTANSKVSYLVVGMEHSQRFGECTGCELDARRITNMIKRCFGYNGETLISEKAVKSDVVRLLREGIERTPEDGLFLFFYSGHGGQEFLGGKEPDDADRNDEFLCLYDTYMMDDEIWDIVSKCRGRVFLYFDACHSATMYRSVSAEIADKKNPKRAKALAADPKDITRTKGFGFRPEKFVKASALDLNGNRSSPRILCWSGCEESEYSFGGSKGGTLTICMLANWESGMSYNALWSKTRSDVQKYQEGQNPVQTYVGDFPKDTEAFK